MSAPAPSPVTFLCVAVASELPFARVLTQSIREHHPEARVVVVSAGGPAAEDLPADVESIGADDLGLPPASAYAALLAPEQARFGALAAALERELAGDGVVAVLSPDTLLVGRIDPLLGSPAGCTLCGRAIAPPPADGLHPDADDLAGLEPVDPGIVVFRGGEAARRIVADWRARAGALGWASDGSAGQSGAVRALLEDDARAGDVVTVEEPGLVLAWWNISGVTLERDPHGLVTADGAPVRILRIPEFDVGLPTRLHPLLNRIRVSDDPVYAALLADLAGRLTEAGAGGPRPKPVPLPDGRALPPVMAHLMAEAIAEEVLAAPPADAASWERFYAYLNAPADYGVEHGMTRYLDAVWQSRDDLREVYPDVRGADASGYVGWTWVYGSDLVPDELLPPRPPHIAADVRTAGRPHHAGDMLGTDPLWGVNVAGFFRSELGLGEAARLLIAGLDAAHVPALPVQGTFIPPCRQGAEFTFATPDEAPYPLNILCLNGDAIPAFAQEAGEDFFAGRHTIALWWWEVGEIPASWQESFRWVDEVWVATDHIRDLIAPSCPVPVTKITLPVAAPPVSDATRAALGLPEDEFVFLYVYDYHSTEARKNPTGLIRAFKEAFPPGSGAHLVLKCINADTMFAHHDRVLLEAGDHPDISFVADYLSVGDKNALIALSDCYVSPHRSEGFGLTPAEAMLLGTPVIATNYGGVLEFLTGDNAYLVDYTMRRVGEHAEPYPADAEWADPDLGHLAERMRYVFEHPEEAAERARRGAREVTADHGPDAAGRSMEIALRSRYEALIAEGAHSLRLRRVRPLDLSDPAEEIERALRGSDQRGGGLRGRAGQVRQRLARSVTARRDRVDGRLVDELAHLDERVRTLTAELDRHRMASHAEVLAQFRRVTREVAGLRAGAGALTVRADDTARTVEHHLAAHDVLPFMASELAPVLLDDPVAGKVLGYRGGTADVEPYRAFTDVFRGTEERVRELQLPYLPLLRDAAPVLDTGCGRGEMLDLLAEAGIAARGVDGDEGMVEHARRKGHDVVLGDVNEHLGALPEGELGGIVSLEVVEHMPADALETFLSLAHSRLRPGGILVAETVNPHALFALKGFWLDPTHHHPLFPEVLLTLARIAGFPSAYVFHPTGTGDIEHDRTRQPTYALVARAGEEE
ncbi:MAG: glycosyltransferase [Solirubrobacteraceae bacterium]|nr:glycosyltransferase [Solirubrobacteraceae bacterium]